MKFTQILSKSVLLCEGSMCNNATAWPSLPDLPAVGREVLTAGPEHSGHIIRLLMAVICPVAILGPFNYGIDFNQCFGSGS